MTLARWFGAPALFFAAGCSGVPVSEPALWSTLDGKPPLVIAHRGASGYLPEHTLAAYKLAIDQGADVVEPDLVFTKDGVLVARHDRYLSTTTDVEIYPQFADRRRVDAYAAAHDAITREDWWVEDFTYDELRILRARQPRDGRPKGYDGKFEIPTFAEILAVVAAKSKEAGRPVGIYPETKHPGFFASIGMDFEAPLLAALEGFDAGPVFIQSFEPEILKRLKSKTDAELVQLVFEERPGAGPNIPLAEIAAYADGVGAAKQLLIHAGENPTDLVSEAHRIGLIVHPWTFRDDEPNSTAHFALDTYYLVGDRGEPLEFDNPFAPEVEYELFYRLGVDGVFTDFPDTAVAVREAMKGRE